MAMAEIVLQVSLKSTKSSEELFRYFADFTTTNEWDPNTVKTELISGEGGIGSKYSNTSKFNGKESSLVYEVIEYKPNTVIRLRGENSLGAGSGPIYVVDGTLRGDGFELNKGDGAELSHDLEAQFDNCHLIMFEF